MKSLRVAFSWLLALFGLSAMFPAIASPLPQKDAQFVRLSHIEGDVRISRGDGKRPDLRKPWEQAEDNVPIGEGFSLATGQGRAEIEFENNSVAYLANNSLLLFMKLRTNSGAFTTHLELVTGTMTIFARMASHDSFVLETPTDKLTFPENSDLRTDSYPDATRITPLQKDGEAVRMSHNNSFQLAQGDSMILREGSILGFQDSRPSDPSDGWDNWVYLQVGQSGTVTSPTSHGTGLKNKAALAPTRLPGCDLYIVNFGMLSPNSLCFENVFEGEVRRSPLLHVKKSPPGKPGKPSPQALRPASRPEIVGRMAAATRAAASSGVPRSSRSDSRYDYHRGAFVQMGGAGSSGVQGRPGVIASLTASGKFSAGPSLFAGMPSGITSFSPRSMPAGLDIPTAASGFNGSAGAAHSGGGGASSGHSSGGSSSGGWGGGSGIGDGGGGGGGGGSSSSGGRAR